MVAVRWHPSPNFGPRRDGLKPSLVVIHHTAMDGAQAALARLCDPDAEVSAHYLIGADGTIWQMVEEDMRSWHAGAGEWHGQSDINSRSIGIELDNRGDHPFSEPLMRALETLLRDIMARWNIDPGHVIGHSDMAPGRKHDPGARFDWVRLSRSRLALHPQPAPESPPDPIRFRRLARRAGFTAPCTDAALLAAVRLRLRPWGRGALCPADMAAVQGAAARQPA